MDGLTIRAAAPDDRLHLRSAIVELHEHERSLHSSRLPGEETADAYLDWMLAEAERSGAVLIAEAGGAFVGFAAGWIEQLNVIEETPDANRFGLISDICVLAPYRGRRIASRLLDALSERLRGAGVSRIRLGVLAANHAARAAYERSGFTLYEMVYEKVVAVYGG
jgi:ribosomal protein S18 acetylase RimI-like enzyme